MPQLPEVLVDRLRSGRCVLCAGAGLRTLANMPSWSGILSSHADVLGERGETAERVDELKQLIRAGRVFLAAGYIERKLGPDTFATMTREALKSPPELPQPLTQLGQLPFRTIISTAGDDLLERAFERDGVRPNVVTLADGRDLKKEVRSRVVLKVMGDIARPSTVCLTARDFERALAASPGYASFGDEVARQKSLVFIGFAPEDPDFSMLFERFFVHAGGSEQEHFAFLPGVGAIASEELWERYRVRVVGEGTLEEFIGELRTAVGDQGPRVTDEDDLEGFLRWLQVEPESTEALDGLLKLEQKARAAKDWDRVVEVLLGRVESAEAGAMRADILVEVARVFENELGDLPKAFTALVAAFREQPERPELTTELERMASAGDLWNDLVAEFAQLAQQTNEPMRWLQLGRWYLDRLNNVEYAIQALEHAHHRDDKNDDIADAYGEALRRGEKWKELVALTEKRVAVTEDPFKKAEYLLLIADVHETRTSDIDKAVWTYRKALEIDPESEAATQLERIFRRKERWKDLVDLLAKRADQSINAIEARNLRREIGEILGDRVGDVPAAVTRLEGVVAEDPRDTAALRALERLYERTGQTTEYVRTLERLSDAVQSSDERVMLLRRLAAEQEEREGGAEKAAAALGELLELRPRDEEALRALERIWRNQRAFPQLISTLERHIAAVEGPARRELYAQMGQIYEAELRDLPRAVDAFLCVEEAGGDAMADLSRLYQKAGEWARAAEVLPKLAERTADAHERAQLWAQAGKISEERLNDDAAAERYLAKALEADPEHLTAMTELAGLYSRRGEWLRAGKLYTEAAERTSNRLDKTRMLYEAGRIHQDRLDDEARATELYVRALALDPEHVSSAKRLAVIYEKREQWAELEPVVDVLARKAEKGDVAAYADIHVRLGFAAKQNGHDEKAIKAYREAHNVDPHSLPALAGLAGLLLKKGEHAEAGKLYDILLNFHGEGLTAGEKLDLYHRQADIHHKQGEADKAIELYDQALGIDPHHRPSLEALVELHSAARRWDKVVAAKRSLLDAEKNADDRGRILEEIGDLLLDKVEDPIQAMGAFQQALEFRPTRALLMHKVLTLCTEQKQWKKAVEMIEKLIALETDPARRAKYRYAAAAILKDELAEDARALELLEQVLDDAPDTQPAFENIEEIHTKRQDWKELDRAYRRMIKRLPPEGLNDIRLRLWSNLGELALNKLGNKEVALAALEVAKTLDRHNLARREQLAELYIEAGPDYAEKAIAEQQWLIRKQPDRLPAYMALRKLYNSTQQFDKMWCLCQALRFLKRAEPEEIEFYEKLRPGKFVPAKRKLTEEIWVRNVLHPDEDRLVNSIFHMAGPALAAWSAQPHKAFGLSRKDKTDPAQHEHLAARAFRYAVETLGIAAPELYFRPDQPAGVQVANAIDKDKQQIIPAFMIGAGLLEKPREKELIFELAKRLAFLRPERYVRYALPTTKALESALRAALAASGASNGAPVDGDTSKLAEHLRRVLPPPIMEQLATVGKKLMEGKGHVIDLTSWLAASDLTASRAAFSLVGDFDVAARMVSTEQAGLSPLAPKERLKELLVFSVSEDYFAIRKQLGVEIQLT